MQQLHIVIIQFVMLNMNICSWVCLSNFRTTVANVDEYIVVLKYLIDLHIRTTLMQMGHRHIVYEMQK
jgi:hypothetical protein